MSYSNCDCGFDQGDPRVTRHLANCSSIRLPRLEGRVTELYAENQRLTSLITDIHDKLYGEVYGWDDGSDEWQEMRVIARKALLGGGENE